MPSIQRRGASWRAFVKLHGVRDSRTFATRAEARAWALAREREIEDGVSGATRHTLKAALERYAREVSPAHRGARWERIRLAKIAREFEGVNRPLRDLRAADVGSWRDARLRVVAPASVSREQQLLRAVLATAQREWGWLTADKLSELKGARKPPATRPRQRRIAEDEIERLVAALGYIDRMPVASTRQRVAMAFLLAIETGMRCGELCGLTWDATFLERRFVRLPKTKNGDAREVPLSPMAAGLLWILPVDGRSTFNLCTGTVDNYFREAKGKVRIADLHFHDSRAEAATRLALKVDVLTLARILGHRDLKSLQVYYRATAEQIAARL